MQQVIEKLTQSGVQVHPWLPENFDVSAIFNLYSRVATYINRYAQPADRYNLQRSLNLIFRKRLKEIKNFEHWVILVVCCLNC